MENVKSTHEDDIPEDKEPHLQPQLPHDVNEIETAGFPFAGGYHDTLNAAGQEFSARVAHVWHAQNGKIVKFEQVVAAME
ncbi:hypothetical protein J7426_22205 [Tropicibacter sp. R16_0]|uniref:hypothetical protein n=1 Tax=Tropicibacter sp. R16_0 TaxID=2821102 RepID=UPI001ADC0838|nr:hypothetical protein [Tropicibacter sp. R16_0]MBO9452992.1 hypothetical protein [Tropicibacter sp. R16_0]